MASTSPSELERLTGYLRALPAQRLVVRSVAEFRPEPLPDATGVNFSRKVFVEVVTVQQGQRVSFQFDNVTGRDAAAAARTFGHDVVERNGNLT